MIIGSPIDLSISDATSRLIDQILAEVGPKVFGRILESYISFVLDQTIRTIVEITGSVNVATDAVNRGVMTRHIQDNLDQLVSDLYETVHSHQIREEYPRIRAVIGTNVAKVVLRTIQAERLHIDTGIKIGA